MNPAAFSQHAEAASQRLTQTRLALLRQMALDGGASHGSQAFRAPGWPASEANEHPDLWQELRQTASAWWQAQPARLVLEVAQPLLVRWAQAHPVRLLATTAAVGAALVLLKPWRLISWSGLLWAALRSLRASSLTAAWQRPRTPADPPVPPH